ncbi:YHYH protein [Patiriisocius marinus]|uniref:YHYH protein n=1 Tax=Patiriisocius marinus TaxID=1397112 RepID=UPI00232B9874|nr:YHYH protein [Patiriisocius marinus]
MKKLIIAFIFILTSINVFAHDDGHGLPSKEWKINTELTSFKADLLKLDNDNVWLMDSNHKFKVHNISEFSIKDQAYIKHKIELINRLNVSQTLNKMESKENPAFSNINVSLLILGGILLLFSIFQLSKRKRVIHVTYGVIGVLLILLVSCKNTNTINATIVNVPENNVTMMQSIFEKFEGVKVHTDDEFIYVASNGLPNHDMMVGIKTWQQQVPINQDYTGENSWAIPLHPKMAAQPLSTKTNLLKGAIAVAVNGIPIFNPLNNRGEDANAIGELDKWGGHCGRADDYHYHLPPLHLQDQAGEANPIAYAVDGFPVYGETNDTLDAYLGKLNSNGSYQYHSIKEYPYFIAGMRGEVTLDPRSKAPENQVSPQPRTHELRPALRPLRGAEIVGFKTLGENSYALTYLLDLKEHIINYSWDDDNNYSYEFINPNGTSTVETYKRKK